MNITTIEIRQAEGYDPMVHRTCTTWADAAATLYGICLAMEKDSPGQGVWKTDVIVRFEGGSWRKYRFDACWEDRVHVGSYERFAKNTLLWSTSESHPED